MAQQGEVNEMMINPVTGEVNNRSDALRRYYAEVNDGACALRTAIIRANEAYLNNRADNFFRRLLKHFHQFTDDYIECQGDICICDNPSNECQGYCYPMRTLNHTFVELLNLLREICIKQVVEGLPSVQISENQVNENFKCTICLSEFEMAEEACQLRCNQQHIFHRNCIKEWFKRENHCPICRQPAFLQRYSVVSPLIEIDDVGEIS